MGGPNADRLAWTGMLKLGRPGHVWIARCSGCRRKGLLPTELILARFGEREPLVRAVAHLKCGTCGRLGAEAYLGELPDPVMR
jgi:hypothetical protein